MHGEFGAGAGAALPITSPQAQVGTLAVGLEQADADFWDTVATSAQSATLNVGAVATDVVLTAASQSSQARGASWFVCYRVRVCFVLKGTDQHQQLRKVRHTFWAEGAHPHERASIMLCYQPWQAVRTSKH